MLLTKTLPPKPPSVGRARRLVADALRDRPSQDRLEEILLLLSEVMTNAVLHAGTEIGLRVAIDEGGVQVEVIDGSAVLPTPPDYAPDASTGRGLGLVALLADDHGVECRDDGKAVWFRVGAEGRPHHGDGNGDDPHLKGWAAGGEAAPTDARTVTLLGVPVHLFQAMRQHDDALLREHVLIRFSRQGYRPPQLPVDLRPVEEALRQAVADGVGAVDVTLSAGPGAAAGARALLDVLARADEQAFAGEMLTPPALPEVRWCRVWHLEEIAKQLAGAPPTPWAPLDVQHQQPDVRAGVDAEQVLDALPHAVVVGDAQNRIVYLNALASALLGWTAEELVGKRVTALIPERLRDRHLAAFTSYLVTGSAGLVDRPLRIAALRRDGTEIDIDVAIAVERTPDGQALFVATFSGVVDLATAEADRLDLRR